MPGMNGAEATVSGAFHTTAYSVTYAPTTGGDRVIDHRWIVHEELENPGAAPVADGATVILRADHLPGMDGAEATIVSSTEETTYMVDLDYGGMRRQTTSGSSKVRSKWCPEGAANEESATQISRSTSIRGRSSGLRPCVPCFTS